jgi:hypothetical protein
MGDGRAAGDDKRPNYERGNPLYALTHAGNATPESSGVRERSRSLQH